jgi:hypothetical protein
MAVEGEHNLDWEPGRRGKGIVDQYGKVHTFHDDEYPMHLDYEAQHNFQGMPRCYFYINEHGDVHPMPGHLDVEDELEKNQETIEEADPNLKVVPVSWQDLF